MFLKAVIALVCLGLLPGVKAGTWDDFVNNLSTDLAPLISLFGETVTKQWLSESLTIWDNLIFAVGPLGVITAVVSAIRVAGSPSLKAFIGRAQESPGTAELELLSCTSGTTSEMWNEGGIARVFGRPHILEVVRRTDPDRSIELIEESAAWIVKDSKLENEKGTLKSKSNITESQKVISGEVKAGNADLEQGMAVEVTEVEEFDDEDETGNLGSPNLSLNIGIRRKSTSWFRTAAIIGLILQSGVLAFGALTVYRYPATFPIAPKQLATTLESDGFISVPSWAFPVTFCGIISLCFGMFLCAFIIERSTNETYFRKARPTPAKVNESPVVDLPQGDVPNARVSPSPTGKDGDGDIYWIQMGNQNVGDQVFNAFIAKHPPNQDYIRSQKREVINASDSILLWGALVITLVGFVIQFVGLRYLHPSVALAQLGLTILMAIVRSGLRTQRLSMDGNLIRRRNPRSINGHELDFFASYLETPGRLHQDSQLAKHGEGPNNGQEPDKFLVSLRISRSILPRSSSNRATKMFKIRSRLADLTSPSVIAQLPMPTLTRSLEWKDFEVRAAARVLAEAIEGVIKEIYKIPGLKNRDHPDHEFSWNTNIKIAPKRNHRMARAYKARFGMASFAYSFERSMEEEEGLVTLRLTRANIPNGVNDAKTPWKIDCHQVEAILGLWSWSRPHQQGRFSRRLAFFRNEDERNTGITELDIWMPFENQSLEKGMQTDPNAAMNYGFEPPHGKPFHLTVSTHSSKIVMCAQDLFINFLLRAADELIDKFGGQTYFRPGKEDGDFRLENSHLEAMVSRFAESGLGSRDDAYACIFTTLRLVDKQPLIEESFERIRESADAQPHTPDGFRQAQTSLQWIEKYCRPEHKKAARIRLCEFYRKFIVHNENDPGIQQLAFLGMAALLNLETSDSPDVVEVSLSYAWIGMQLAIDRNEVLYKYFLESKSLVELCHRYRKIKGAPWNSESAREWLSDCETAVIIYLLGTPSHDLNVNLKDSDGRSALSYAAQRNPELALWLLKQPGINQAKDKLSALSLAAEAGHAEVVEALLENDSSPINNRKNALGKPPLMLACERGHEDVVRILLNDKYGVNPNTKSRGLAFEGYTALHFAVANNRLAIVQLLVDLELRIDINAENGAGYTPLTLAASKGYLEVVKVLVHSGANIDHKGSDESTPVSKAVENGHLEVVQFLVAKNADLEADGMTPLGHAIDANRIEIAKVLLSARALDLEGRYRDSLLRSASEDGFVEIVELLLDHGIDPDVLERPLNDDHRGTHSLEAAVKAGHLAVVELLLNRGADPDALWESGQDDSPLTCAIEANRTDIAELLVNRNANVHHLGRSNHTPLYAAARVGNLELVTLLIERGAEVNFVASYAYTPLYFAALNGSIEMVKLLLDHGAVTTFASTQKSPLAGVQEFNEKNPSVRSEELVTMLEGVIVMLPPEEATRYVWRPRSSGPT